jgi:hypothetical protein
MSRSHADAEEAMSTVVLTDKDGNVVWDGPNAARERDRFGGNPWSRLPADSPYVLAEDAKEVQYFNARARKDHQFQIKVLLPEPFVGDPAAPVLLLSNNPGVGKWAKRKESPEFMASMRDNIELRFSTYPFIYLDPAYSKTGSWWRQKLKRLLQKFGDEVVARSVCNIVYFPYPSAKFRHTRHEVSSQQYSFQLVRDALKRGAMIVLMRRGQLERWQEKVTELNGYGDLIVLRNPQMPSISPRNCKAGDYEKIVDAIEAAEMKRREATADE